VINGVIAWLILRNHPQVPLWGNVSMGVDLLATGFFLPFAMCMIVSRTIRSEVVKGKLPALKPDQIEIRGMYRRSILVRSLVLGVAGVVFVAAPLVVLLDLAHAQPVAFLHFVGFKAVWAGLLTLLVSPILAWWALQASSAQANAA